MTPVIADPEMVKLYGVVERIAPVNLPVLITGETGCGKELLAQAVHDHSDRCRHAMVAVNCAAMSDYLAENELFGHERGAFTGAVTSRRGLIEAASGSTLFLDEVGELSPFTQSKLLRVLETKRVMRVGAVTEQEVDVRIVAATNRDLNLEMDAKRFRRDLYYRLSAAKLHLPPLRKRTSEIRQLALSFLRQARRQEMQISDSAMKILLAYRWPGNIRELRNMMMYFASVLQGDVVLPEHVEEKLVTDIEERDRIKMTFRPLADEIREFEIRRIKQALLATRGNQTKAAALISMPLRTFFGKVKLYGLMESSE